MENDYTSFYTKFINHPEINAIWRKQSCVLEEVKENNSFNKFKHKLRLLWARYKVDDELDFNRVAQQLFEHDTEIFEEIKDNMLVNDFPRFKQELMEGDQFKDVFKIKESIKPDLVDTTFIKFKSEMVKLFTTENLQLDDAAVESLVEKLYKNEDNNIADFFKDTVTLKKSKQLIVKIQSNEQLKTLWASNMLVFHNVKRILKNYIEFTSGSDNDEVHIVISELFVNSENGMKLIENKCTHGKFDKIKSDFYNDAEIKSKVFREKNIITSIITPLIPPINIDDNNSELEVILNCTFGESNVLQLEDLVQAGELQYINQTLKDISEKLVDDFHRKRHTFPEFIQACLTPVMYLLKRLQTLDTFLNTLTLKYQRIRQKANNQSQETTSLSLRMLLHILLMNSDIFLRRIIVSLASRRNPVPLISPNIQNRDENERYEFIPAIIHVWNYKKPTILSFGVGPCQGKSTLLNQLFRSAFEQTTNSIYFRQTIDVDFGYCFNPERTLNIADTHGIIDKNYYTKSNHYLMDF